MKKFVIIATVMLLGAGVALAASINVPFFLDDTPPGGGFPPQTDTMFFIGLKNTTAAPIVLTVDYRKSDGTVSTISVGNATFSLGAFESISFRPHFLDDGVDSQNAGAAFINPGRSDDTAGAATFTWAGGTNDIQGRGVQIGGVTENVGSFSFLLPPGV